MSNYLHSDQQGPVTRVTLSRPDVHNAFDDKLIEELTHEGERLHADTKTRVVVLASVGKSFCAGADLNWMKRMAAYSRDENIADATAMSKMFHTWDTLPKPVVGRIHGAALGGGTGLVAVCDIAVASESAVFGFTEVRLGILPAVISPFVMSRIGGSAARELFLTGERFSAQRAWEIGLVTRVTSADELDSGIDAYVQQLLSGGPEAQTRIKQLIREMAGRDAESVRELTSEAIADARASQEGVEGIQSFLNRRRPAWREDK